MPSAAIRVLLADSIDYAGLFPPAALPLKDVAFNYAAYRTRNERWALGRLVVPAARLSELADAARTTQSPNDGTWHVSALVGADTAADAQAIRRFNDDGAGRRVVDAIELRAASPSQVTSAVSEIDRVLGEDIARSTYVEIPIVEDPAPLTAAIASSGGRGKIRMGGVTPDVFPSPVHVARFLARCAQFNLAFKATAGLHHPCRGQYRLTYAADAPIGTMFGFLNVFLASAYARAGTEEARIVELLEEPAPSSFHFSDEGVEWRHRHLSNAQLSTARSTFIIAFGSCSFREPIDDLTELGLL